MKYPLMMGECALFSQNGANGNGLQYNGGLFILYSDFLSA